MQHRSWPFGVSFHTSTSLGSVVWGWLLLVTCVGLCSHHMHLNRSATSVGLCEQWLNSHCSEGLSYCYLGEYFLDIEKLVSTLCLKQGPIFSLLYNFDTCERILIFLGRMVTSEVSNQKTLHYATLNNLCFCTTWKNGEPTPRTLGCSEQKSGSISALCGLLIPVDGQRLADDIKR